MQKKTVLVFFGTRPEAIKMVPVTQELRQQGFKVIVGLSGQHQEMVEDVLNIFNEKADFSLGIQAQVKNTEDVVRLCLSPLCDKIREYQPDLVLVHGDTSSTLAGAMAAFYCQTPVGHVEAGLRSHNIYSPWPEEMNRKLTAEISTLHFSPTVSAAKNLQAQGIGLEKIHITGNTVVDALYLMNKINMSDASKALEFTEKYKFLNSEKKWILFTGHRRENFGKGLYNVMKAIIEIAQQPDVEVVFPIHPNPKVRASFADLLHEADNIHVVHPLPYQEMVWLLSKCSLVVTDSGGLQEEAPSFKVPVVVTRDTTERQETVDMGWAKLVGTNTEAIIKESLNYLRNPDADFKKSPNPYGDGTASEKIALVIKRYLSQDADLNVDGALALSPH